MKEINYVRSGAGLGFGSQKHFHLKIGAKNIHIPFCTFSFSLEELMKKIKSPLEEAINMNKNAAGIILILMQAIKADYPHAETGEIEKVVKKILALTLPDMLVDQNLTALNKILPRIMGNLSEDIKQLLSKYDLNKFYTGEEGKRFLDSLAAYYYQEEQHKDGKEFINLIKDKLDSKTLSELQPEILSYLLPVILREMNPEDLIETAWGIAEQMPIKYFKCLNSEYFIPEINTQPERELLVKNINHRTLQFFPPNSPSSNTTLNFREKTWRFHHVHFHPEKRDTDEREYILEGHENAVGEMHFVFELPNAKNQSKKKVMVIASVMEIGQHNEHIQKLLEAIFRLGKYTEFKNKLAIWENNQIEEKPILEFDDKISIDYLPTELFIGDFIKDQKSYLYHPWGSLRTASPAHKMGLVVLTGQTPITLSLEQYNALEEIFGTLQPIEKRDETDPTHRKPGNNDILSMEEIFKYLEEDFERLKAKAAENQSTYTSFKQFF